MTILNDIQKTTAILCKGLKDEFSDDYDKINDELLKPLPSTVTNTKVVGNKVINEHTPVDMGYGCTLKNTKCEAKKTLNESKTRAKLEELLKPQVDAKHISNEEKSAVLKNLVDKALDECKSEGAEYTQVTITLSDNFKELVHNLAQTMVQLGITEVEVSQSLLDIIKKDKIKKQKN